MKAKKKVKARGLKKPKKVEPTLINLKVHKRDHLLIVQRARKYAQGNVSRWLRYAGVNHVPRGKDLAS